MTDSETLLLWPVPVYVGQVEGHKEINRQLLPLLLANAGRGKNPGAAYTSDVPDIGDSVRDRLHWLDEAAGLFDILRTHILAALREQGVDLTRLVPHITKSWYTTAFRGEGISAHSHLSSHFSVAYYVKWQPGMGNLVLAHDRHEKGLYLSEQHFYSPGTPLNCFTTTPSIQEGAVVIFPSWLAHYTEQNTTPDVRVSVSADILLTIHEHGSSEFGIPHPSKWQKVE